MKALEKQEIESGICGVLGVILGLIRSPSLIPAISLITSSERA